MTHSDNARLPTADLWRNALLLGLAAAGVTLVWTVYGAYVPIFLADRGLDATAIGFFTSLTYYADLLVVPLVGAWSDRIHTRLGRRKPFLLVGVPLAALTCLALPYMPTLPLLVGTILLLTLAMALFRAPRGAWLGDLFPATWRTQASGVINLLLGVAGVVGFLGGGILYQRDPALPFVAAGLSLLVLVLITAMGVREPSTPRPAGGPNTGIAPGPLSLASALRGLAANRDRSLLAILGAALCAYAGPTVVATYFTLYGRDVLGLDAGAAAQLLALYAGAAVLFALPGGMLAARFGRRRTVAVSCALLAALFSLGYFTTNRLIIEITLVVAGAASITASVTLLPMVLDAAPTRHPAIYTGLYYAALAVSGILSPPLAGLLIDTLHTYRAIFLFGPVTLLLAVGLIGFAHGGEARRAEAIE